MTADDLDAEGQTSDRSREGDEGVRLWVDSLDGLARADDIEHADRIVLDLDPGEGVDWNFMVETALALGEGPSLPAARALI